MIDKKQQVLENQVAILTEALEEKEREITALKSNLKYIKNVLTNI